MRSKNGRKERITLDLISSWSVRYCKGRIMLMISPWLLPRGQLMGHQPGLFLTQAKLLPSEDTFTFYSVTSKVGCYHRSRTNSNASYIYISTYAWLIVLIVLTRLLAANYREIGQTSHQNIFQYKRKYTRYRRQCTVHWVFLPGMIEQIRQSGDMAAQTAPPTRLVAVEMHREQIPIERKVNFGNPRFAK